MTEIKELAVVIAFDPGGTTGWCVMGMDPDTLTGVSLSVMPECLVINETGEFDCSDEREGVNEMVALFDTDAFCGKAAVVIEDFILDVHKATMARHMLSPVRLTAAFTYTIGANVPVFIQHRSLAKTTCTDERLKHWGLYDNHSGGHARDATRHAVYFLRTAMSKIPRSAWIRYNAWPHLFDKPKIPSVDMDIASFRSVDSLEYRKVKKAGDRIPGLG